MKKKAWTLIIRMPTGQYHVCLTTSPLTYFKKKMKERNNGYFSWPKNKGKAQILYAFKGDHFKKVKAFGGKAFVEMMDKEDVFFEMVTSIQ